MELFGKKKEGTKSCCCGESCTPESMADAEAAKASMGVKVLGADAPSTMLWKKQPWLLWKNWAWTPPLTM